jgi:hypothetical protein
MMCDYYDMKKLFCIWWDCWHALRVCMGDHIRCGWTIFGHGFLLTVFFV